MKYDLHLHTKCSDGKYTRLELLKKANDVGLEYLCFTDHNYIDDDIDKLNNEYLQTFECNQNIEMFNSTELDIDEYPRLHILGYDLKNIEKLKKELKILEQINTDICKVLIKKIYSEYKILIPFDELRKMTTNGNVTKNVVVQWLIDNKYAKTVYEAGMKYTSKYSPCYVKRESLKLDSAISLIKEGNGLVVIAHPSSLKLLDEELYEFIKKLKDKGLDGIEVYNSDKTNKEQLLYYCGIAQKLNMLETCGSDFHREKKDSTFGIDNDISNEFIKTLKGRKQI